MDPKELFDRIYRRPGMYGLDGSFGEFTTFLRGFEAGNPEALDGWREWLVIQLDDGNNLVWEGLVHHLALPGRQPRRRELDDGDSRIATDALFDLLQRFLTERERKGGAAAIKAEHQAWLERQSWYTPPRRPVTAEPQGSYDSPDTGHC